MSFHLEVYPATSPITSSGPLGLCVLVTQADKHGFNDLALWWWQCWRSTKQKAPTCTCTLKYVQHECLRKWPNTHLYRPFDSFNWHVTRAMAFWPGKASSHTFILPHLIGKRFLVIAQELFMCSACVVVTNNPLRSKRAAARPPYPILESHVNGMPHQLQCICTSSSLSSCKNVSVC